MDSTVDSDKRNFQIDVSLYCYALSVYYAKLPTSPIVNLPLNKRVISKYLFTT